MNKVSLLFITMTCIFSILTYRNILKIERNNRVLNCYSQQEKGIIPKNYNCFGMK